jgi:hypothetical protein
MATYEEDHRLRHRQHQHQYLMTRKKTQTTNHQMQTRILMESPLLGKTGTQPQDTMQEDNNTTGKECTHNGDEEEGKRTGTCHQIQNND